MIYDYIIIGGGPTGLSLSYILTKNNYNVCLIEKYHKLGGSWNAEWIDDKYFTENAPRVLSSNGPHINFLNEIGMNHNDFQYIYGTMLETNKKVFYFITNYFKLNDYLIFGFEILFYKLRSSKLLLQEWMNESNLSEQAKKCIRIISITICDTPNNTNHHDFFGDILGTDGLIQMKEPNKWINILQEYFKSMNNIEIYTDTLLQSINSDDTSINDAICLKDGIQIRIKSKNIVLCTQSDSIYSILKNSNKYIQNNWYSIDKMKKWSENTHYNGFGFQLHFKEKIKFPKEWCWSCISEWNIIILPVSEWLKVYTKDKNIKTVWSCCIVDMETKSSRLNKTPNECNKDEIINEILFQLKNLNYNLPNPHMITLSPHLKKINGKWKSNNTGFTRKNMDYLPMKGKLNGLYALGCFTDPGYNTIAYMKTSIQAVQTFLNKYHQDLHSFKKKKVSYILILILFIIGLLVNQCFINDK